MVQVLEIVWKSISVAISILAGLWITPSHAEELECTLEQSALVGALDLKSKEIAKVVSKGIKDRQYSETVVLKNGLNVSYSVGGCTHYSFSLKIEGLPTGIKTKDPFHQAKALLKLVPFLAAERGRREGFDRFLDSAIKNDAKILNGNYGANCGDPLCELTVTDQALTLSHDFAM